MVREALTLSLQVIKPHNKVFLGHPLKKYQLSANVGKAIADRAIKCAKKPTIRFDYDHKWDSLLHT